MSHRNRRHRSKAPAPAVLDVAHVTRSLGFQELHTTHGLQKRMFTVSSCRITVSGSPERWNLPFSTGFSPRCLPGVTGRGGTYVFLQPSRSTSSGRADRLRGADRLSRQRDTWNPDMTIVLIGKGHIWGWLVVRNRGHSGFR